MICPFNQNDKHLTQSFIDWTRIFHINHHILYKVILVHCLSMTSLGRGRHSIISKAGWKMLNHVHRSCSTEEG
ncbi:unnamed protein product [Musa acuminata subsp. malaccensis]|uniref:(wild Malaysian banana) hypothetical protein n=1 Tax=Musa acuminata subsp. malaccensis TaxID=214687 RepID=A0A8D7AG14_MUSAM|nr:unnamed protein product [Musa acuminata subsp. malaccensis]